MNEKKICFSLFYLIKIEHNNLKLNDIFSFSKKKGKNMSLAIVANKKCNIYPEFSKPLSTIKPVIIKGSTNSNLISPIVLLIVNSFYFSCFI